MATKEIRIVQAKNGMFFAKYNGGGQMPAELSGLWTGEKDLQKRVDKYLEKRTPATKTQKEEAVAKKTTTRKPRTQEKED